MMSSEMNGLLSLIDAHSDMCAVIEENCLAITNDEGVEAFLTVGEKQILVEAVLFPAVAAIDTAALNNKILRTMHVIPLTSIGIKHLAGEDYYIAFGALSSDSKDSVVIEEIETLFANVDDFIELYAEDLKEQ